jgi:DNA-binding NarL/FixJ family response regulator
MYDQKPIRIVVVDDHFMVRLGLAASLSLEPDMTVVAEAATGDVAISACREQAPNLVLMDVRLPGLSSAEACAAILREFPAVRVLMLSTHSNSEEVYRALQAGASGYVLKSAQREDLLRAIREVSQGRSYIDPLVAPLLAGRMSQKSLTTREIEVLRMVARGLGNKEVAAALQIAEVTVKLHVSHILEKLNVRDRTQAATVAIQRGIIALG